jgi:hypothetical protein
MMPENVLKAVSEQLRPLVVELSRYNTDVLNIELDIGTVKIEFKQ